MATEVRIREATADDERAVLNVLDGAALETDHGALKRAIDRDEVLVAVDDTTDARTVLGALVLEGSHVSAVAVRRRRRGQGIGTALVEAAADRRDRLRARFDGSVRPFYEALGFAVEPTTDDGRYRGVLARS